MMNKITYPRLRAIAVDNRRWPVTGSVAPAVDNHSGRDAGSAAEPPPPPSEPDPPKPTALWVEILVFIALVVLAYVIANRLLM